ncbi:MAG: DUF4332 domain-containing protein [Pseudomonadota bacterium]
MASKAQALINSGEIAEARALLVGFLKSSECDIQSDAVAGKIVELDQVLFNEALQAAQRLAENGQAADAIAAYQSLIQQYPETDYLREEIPTLKRQVFEQELAGISRLASTGQLDAAREAQLDLIKRYAADDDVDLDAIPDELKTLTGGSFGFWRAFKRFLFTTGMTLLEILAAGLIVFVAIKAVLSPLQEVPNISIEAFSTRGKDVASSLGQHFSNSILNRMQKLRHSFTGELNVMTGNVDAADLPSEISSVVPGNTDAWYSPVSWLKVLGHLYAWLTRKKIVTITGDLLVDADKALLAEVRLIRNGRIEAAETIRFDDFDDEREPITVDLEERFQRFAQIIAIWAVFAINRQRVPSRAVGGTLSWQAFALLQSALDANKDKRKKGSRLLYQKALSFDPDYRSPKINLGNLLLGSEPETALQYLERAREEARRDPWCYMQSSYYVASYNVIVIYARRAALSLNAAKIDLHSARMAISESEQLFGHINFARARIGNLSWSSTSADAFQYYLNRVQVTLGPLIAAMLSMEEFETGVAWLKDVQNANSPHALHLLNVACTNAVFATIARKLQKHAFNTYLDESVAYLRRSLKRDSKNIEAVRNNPVLGIVRELRADEISQLYTMYAIDVAPSPPAPTVRPLAGLTLIGSDYAGQLADHGIETHDQLLLACRDAGGRDALAQKLSVPKVLVMDWACAVDLIRINGLESEHLDLLRMANVSSITDLIQQQATVLASALHGYANAIGAEAPDSATLQRWITDARTHTLPSIT